MLAYLICPSVQFFFIDLEIKKLIQILGITGSCIDGTQLSNFSLTAS